LLAFIDVALCVEYKLYFVSICPQDIMRGEVFMKKTTFVLLALGACMAANAQVFTQDFESGLGANESTGGIFVINNTNAPINNGTNMMGHRADYVNDDYSYYQLTLDLTNWTNVSLSFDYAGIFETHFDRFNVLASTGAITPPAGLLNPTAASDMQYIDMDHDHHVNLGQFAYDTSAETGGESGTALFDLSSFDGQLVTLRFQFGSDGSVTDAGFNMDNLVVTGSVVPEPASMAALGMGALALIRRRRAKK
jgi:hypothetical protein